MLKNKRRLILVIFILMVVILSNSVFGSLVDLFESSINTGYGSDLKKEGEKILGVISVVGTIISVAMLMVLGIKYMLGSAEQKAEYKKTMLPYIIGCVLLFGATNIVDIVYKAVNDIGNNVNKYDSEATGWEGRTMYLQCGEEECRKEIQDGKFLNAVCADIPSDKNIYCPKCYKLLYEAYEELPKPNTAVVLASEKYIFNVTNTRVRDDDDFVNWYNREYNIDWYFESIEAARSRIVEAECGECCKTEKFSFPSKLSINCSTCGELLYTANKEELEPGIAMISATVEGGTEYDSSFVFSYNRDHDIAMDDPFSKMTDE